MALINLVLQAPVQAKTAVGKMVEYYLQMEPHLFDAAVEEQLQALQDEKEEKEKQAREASNSSGKNESEMVLYRSQIFPLPYHAPCHFMSYCDHNGSFVAARFKLAIYGSWEGRGGTFQ